MATINPDEALRNASLNGVTQTVQTLLSQNICSEEAKIYAMYNAIFCEYEDIIKLLLQNGVSPTANNGAVLKVAKQCKNKNIIALFKDYLN